MRIGRASVLFTGCTLLLVFLVGCATLEYVPNRQVLFFHKELAAADRAVEAARQAGKDKECPHEFQAAEKLKNDALDIYLSCRTSEGIAKANEAAGRANALCARKTGVAKPAAAKETIALKVQFDTAKADIKTIYHDEIAKVAAYLKKHPNKNVTIEGHTDSVGSKKYNQGLSERRAESVKKYLVDKFGVDASRISTKGYGKSKPIADNKTEEGRQNNRRIEATFR